MNKNNIAKIRSRNLNKWFDTHSVPENEKSYISQLKSGKASFGEKAARRLESTYSMPYLYLDMIDENSIYEKQTNYIIEVLDITASVGNGYLNSDIQEVIKLIEYDNEEAKILFNGIPSSNIKVINLKGDSMQGTFDCGDAIYVDVSKREFDSDGIYVFTFGRGVYIKRLQLIKNILRVKSDNKLYDPWDIHENEFDQLYIHGKVIFSQSMLLRKHG